MKAKEARSQKSAAIGFGVGVVAVVALVLIILNPQPPKDAPMITEAHGQKVAYHWHVSLWYYNNGVRQYLAEDVGNGPAYDPEHPLAKYGIDGQMPLHTHDRNSVIHIEPTEDRLFTFGDYLSIWGLDLEGKTVKMTKTDFNGQVTEISDYQNYILHDSDQLQLWVSDNE